MSNLRGSLRNYLLAPLAGIAAGTLVILALSPLAGYAMDAYFHLCVFTKCNHPAYYKARFIICIMALFAAGAFAAAWAGAITATRHTFFTGLGTVAVVIAGYWAVSALSSSGPSDKDIRDMFVFIRLMLLFAAAGALAGSVTGRRKR